MKDTSDFQLSAIKAIELAAAKRPDVVSLAQGIPSFGTPEVIREFVKDKIDKGLCDKYSLTNGLSAFREEVALSLADDGLSYDPEDEIIATAGSIEGITATLLAMTNPGDEVLLPSPTYASYLAAIKIAGCIPKYVPLDEDANFDFNVDAFEKAITRKTSVILYCSPNNPTGTLYSEDKTRSLLTLAERHNLTILIDEVYKDFYYTNDIHVTPCSVPEARHRIIRACSFSKSFAMTGWRIGFLHADRAHIQNILKYHDAMVTCAPVASQYAGIAALRYGQEHLDRFKKEFKARRDYTIKVLDELSDVLDYQLPKAAYFAFPRIKGSVPLAHDSERLAYDILDKANVALVPGVAFGPSGESHLRIMFGRDEAVLKEGLSRFADYLAQSGKPVSPHPKARASTAARSADEPNAPRRIVRKLLATAARMYLKRSQPLVIGIAGTRGKTTFKRTISELLSRERPTRSNILSYNTEVGLPLSILKLDVPKSFLEYLLFPLRLAGRVFLDRDTAKIVVLEYGIRSVGDAQTLLSIARPDWLLISDTSQSDPSMDHQGTLDGIEYLATRVKDKQLIILKDEQILERNDKLKQSAVLVAPPDGKNLQGTSNSFVIHRETVGRNARRSLASACVLAEQLGYSEDTIRTFL